MAAAPLLFPRRGIARCVLNGKVPRLKRPASLFDIIIATAAGFALFAVFDGKFYFALFCASGVFESCRFHNLL